MRRRSLLLFSATLFACGESGGSPDDGGVVDAARPSDAQPADVGASVDAAPSDVDAAAPPADAGAAPFHDPRFEITTSSVGVGMIGRFEDVGFELRWSPTSTTVLEAELRDSSGDVKALMTSDLVTDERRFVVAGVEWIETASSALSQADRDALGVFSETDVGRALPSIAGLLYFEDARADVKPFRVAAVLLYRGLSEHYAADAKRVAQPPGSTLPGCDDAPCGLRTNDALFDCDVPVETSTIVSFPSVRRDVVVLIDGLIDECQLVDAVRERAHEPRECYGACGASCIGCRTIDLRCVPDDVRWEGPLVDGVEGTSPVRACYTGTGNFYPRRPMARDPACASPDSVLVTQWKLCPVKDACFRHDECMRHDTGFDWWTTCQARGARGAGPLAAIGYPAGGHNYKWFTSSERPLYAGVSGPELPAGLGMCRWTYTCIGGACVKRGLAPAEPPPIDHALDQATCLVHDCKHERHESFCRCPDGRDSTCPSTGAESPSEKVCRGGRCVHAGHIAFDARCQRATNGSVVDVFSATAFISGVRGESEIYVVVPGVHTRCTGSQSSAAGYSSGTIRCSGPPGCTGDATVTWSPASYSSFSTETCEGDLGTYTTTINCAGTLASYD
ncbi:hypothetical protein L6R52_25655 [Myxococcota bacterium]|nr:hypothetical protein [Myxococcota bacterium]